MPKCNFITLRHSTKFQQEFIETIHIQMIDTCISLCHYRIHFGSGLIRNLYSSIFSYQLEAAEACFLPNFQLRNRIIESASYLILTLKGRGAYFLQPRTRAFKIH